MIIFIIQVMLLQFLAVQSAFQGETSLSVGSQNATALEQGLMHGDAAGAVLLVHQNVAPAVASAIRVLKVTDNKQPLLDTLSLFFALLKPINTTALPDLVATSFQGSLFYEGLGGRMGPGFTTEALLVASALSSQTIYEAFVQAKHGLETVQAVRQVVDEAPLNLTTKATARNALLSAYGTTQQNLQQAQGNTTIIGTFLFSSAYLSAYLGGASSASQNITSLLSSTTLTAQDKSDAIAQAIALGLGQRETQAVAVLALAALSSMGADTIKDGFAKATTANLNTMCSSQDAAQALGTEAGQAVAAAIPSVFGPHPCALFKGTTGALYSSNNTSKCDPQLDPNFIRTGIANKSDCTAAIAQLRASKVANCSTLNSTHAETEYSAQGNPGTPLVTVGNCQILFDGENDQYIPCSQIAEYASNLAEACSNNQLGTGGRLYTLPNSSVSGSTIILSQTSTRVTAYTAGTG